MSKKKVKKIDKIINVFSYQVIKEDGTEISRSKEMVNTLTPGTLDGSDNLVDTDISAEPAEVSAICTAAWTTRGTRTLTSQY